MEIKTPAFIIDKVELEANIESLKDALSMYWDNYAIGYSYKTNALPWLLKEMKNQGCLAEVVSDTEYLLAENQGYREDIIFNGPVKGQELFYKALLRNNIINIDSKRELEWLKEYRGEEWKAQIGLRVNFNLEEECPGETVAGEEGNRFGFCLENKELERAIFYLQSAGIRLDGLHMHVSTISRSTQIYKALAKKAVQIAKQYQLELTFIDIGGGFFAGGNKKSAFYDYIKVISQELKSYFNPAITKLIVEPGASVIASPVSFVTKVLDVKDTIKHRFVITNGSRLQIDPFMAKKNYSYRVETSGKNIYEEQVVCGCTCMEKDRIISLKQDMELQEGDYVIYECVGSYTMCLNALFIEYFPYVYVKEQEDIKLVRDKWGIEEFLQKSVEEVSGEI